MTKPSQGLSFFPFSDIGRREQQEDYFYTAPPPRGSDPWLAVVADGMGGHESGNIASKEGVHAVRKAFEADASVRRGNISRALSEATLKGHQAVLHAAEHRGALGNMGSTVVAFVINGGTLYWSSAGDSRLYLHRHGKLMQLTRDFTVAEDMRNSPRRDEWSTVDIDNSPRADALTSFMGTDNWREHSGDMPLEPGDVLVACTDGVYGTLGNDGIAAACRSAGGRGAAQQVADELQRRVAEAKDPKQDNATAIVVCFEGSGTGGLMERRLGLGLAAAAVIALAAVGVRWMGSPAPDTAQVSTGVSAPVPTPTRPAAQMPAQPASPAAVPPQNGPAPALPVEASSATVPPPPTSGVRELEERALALLRDYPTDRGNSAPTKKPALDIVKELDATIDELQKAQSPNSEGLVLKLSRLRYDWSAVKLSWEVDAIRRKFDGVTSITFEDKTAAVAELRRIIDTRTNQFVGPGKAKAEVWVKKAHDLLNRIQTMRVVQGPAVAKPSPGTTPKPKPKPDDVPGTGPRLQTPPTAGPSASAASAVTSTPTSTPTAADPSSNPPAVPASAPPGRPPPA